ncbi:hypothetical protein [Coralliovum pocilloporae]|uniref:hypothetical protein n=1 Tax=Coralliovum pocilloporae TaxID=3066369 RepID=UPI003306B637
MLTARTIATVGFTVALTASSFGNAAFAAKDQSIEDFINGFPEAAPNRCVELSAKHGAGNVWVGKFRGRDSGRYNARKSANATVCFTKRDTCKRWLAALNRDFSLFQYVSKCTRGYNKNF